MVAELIVRINGANKYNIDAKGKDVLSVNLTQAQIGTRNLVDGNLVISCLKQFKK